MAGTNDFVDTPPDTGRVDVDDAVTVGVDPVGIALVGDGRRELAAEVDAVRGVPVVAGALRDELAHGCEDQRGSDSDGRCPECRRKQDLECVHGYFQRKR